MKILYIDHEMSQSKDFWIEAWKEIGETRVCLVNSFPNDLDRMAEIGGLIDTWQPDHTMFSSGVLWDLRGSAPLCAALGRDPSRTSCRYYGDVYDAWSKYFVPSAPLVTALFITNDKGAVLAPNAHWVPCPAFPCASEPLQTDFSWEAVFVGGSQSDSPERGRFLRILIDRLGEKFLLAGQNWGSDIPHRGYVSPFECMNSVYPKSRVILNHMESPWRSLGRCASNRLWNAMNSGRPVLSTYLKDMDTVVTPGIHWYQMPNGTPEEEAEWVVEFLKHTKDADINRVGQAGRTWVRRNATYAIVARRILRMCGHDV